MSPAELCQRYLAALERADLEAVLALFTPDAEVVSPLYGTQPATAFYRALFADTARSRTTLLNVFVPAGDGQACALHFRYEWTLASGRTVNFECADVFALNPAGDRFTRLTILYDTAPLRADFHAR
jgi:ketosteroid isomerase-like protein